jgi:hypothetical protein
MPGSKPLPEPTSSKGGSVSAKVHTKQDESDSDGQDEAPTQGNDFDFGNWEEEVLTKDAKVYFSNQTGR